MGFIALERAKLHYVFENIFHVVERLVSEKEAKMNKIFKVIWSKSKQCYVVVSELAKNTTGKKKIVVASIFAAMVAGQAMQVDATSGSFYDTGAIKGAIAIGKAGSTAPQATDENAIAIGQAARANGRGGVALGNDTRSAQNAIAAAWDSQATGKNSVAVGTGTRATGLSSTAVGDGAQATANGAVALGQSTESAGNSVAAGFNAKARSNNTVAIGVEANNDGSITNNASSVSVGIATRARAVGSMAMGVSADASGKYSLALGSGDVGTDYTAGTNYPSASGEKSIAIGYNSNAGDLNALAIGTGASVNKQNATAVGSGASVTGHNATAVGNDTKAIKQYDNAFGYTSTASGGAATAVGYLATASGNQTVALGSTINSTAQYATGIGYSVNSQGEGSVAIGAGTDALGAIPAKQVKATAKNAIAIGRATQATSQDATAIGTEATASNTDAIAIGRKSNASGSTSIGFGYNTKASDTNTVAIGTDVSATAESAIALGRKTTASGLSSTAVGPIANASGKYSSAFGMSATTSEENALALGTSANATRKNSVSLGSNSSTVNAATSESSVTFGNKNITWTAGVLSGTNLDGMQVSVGATGAERQIKNVAAGKISATSTDAINGAQLYAVAEGLRTKYVSINSTISNNQNNDGATGSDSVAIGPDAAATKPDSVAMGRSVKANGQQSIAVGKSAEAKQDYNVAIGSEVVANGNNSVAMGRYASSTGTAALAIGAYGNNKSTASGNYSIAIGRDVTASGVDSIATGRDSKATAEKALAYGANAQALATNSIAIGADSQANVDKGIAIGASSKANVASGVAGYNPNTEIIVRTDTYAPTAANTWSGTWGAVSVGDGTNTRQITGVAAGKADTDAVNVAQLKSVNLAFTGNSGSGDVNLSKSKLAVEGGTNSFITTTAANKKLEINTTQGTLKNTSGTVSVNGANGLAVAQNVADVINQANADQTIKYKANGTGNNSVKLSDGLNFTNGITTTATVGANGQVTFDLNTATQKSITDSATAVARTISLGGDTGITTAKSLSSANVNFGIKSGSPTYLTTVANGNDVTLTINEQAIKNAAKDASSFKVKANSTAAEDVKGGDTVVFNNGDNIAITQTGKTFKIATAPNVKFDTAIIGTNTTIGSTGITTNKVTVGNVSIDGTNGINAGNKAITNVGTGIVANSNADNSNVANIGDVKTIANDAVANLSTSLGVTDGTNSGTVNLKNQSLKVVGTGVAKATVSGQTITVDVAKGTLTNNTTTGALTGTAGVVDANDMAAAVNTAITKAVDTATGTQKLDISAGGTDSSVNLKNQKLTVAGTGAATASLNNQTITVDVAQGTFTNKSDGTTSATAGVAKATDVAAAINNTNTVLNQKIADATTSLGTLGNNTFTLKADSTDTTAQNLNKSGGLAFKVAGDGDLVSTSATTDAVKVTVKKGTLSTNTDGTINKAADGVVTADNMTTVVNDAITKAVTSAKDGSAWNISTNGGTATKVSGGNTVDLINGDNIEITQDGTDGKKITVKTKKDLTLDSVTAANTVKVGAGTNLITLDGTSGAVSGNTFTGNTFTAGNASMNTTGFRLTGGPSVTTTGIDAGNKVITNVASGGTTSTNAANIGDVNDKVTSAINNLTTNLTKNTSISYTANNDTPVKTVSLNDGFKFTNGTLTTAEVAAGGVVKFNVTQGTLSTDTNGTVSAGTTGVATTSDVASAVNSAVTAAVTNATGNQKLDISAGGTDSSVNLKTQKLTVTGTGAATTSVAGQTITVNVAEGTFTNKSDGTTSATAGVAKATDVAAAINNTNTVLNQKIADATTSLGTLGNNTFTLKADSTDTTAQNLNKSGGLAFKVAGDGDLVSTSATTDAVKVTVKKGTLSTNTDGTINKAADGVVTADNMTTVVNDAITKAVTSAKDGSAWNISTNGGTATKVSGGNTVDLINGDNIEITQDGTDGKKITVKTKKDLTLDSVTAANTVKVGSGTNLITLDGATGGVSGNTFTAGNASMNTTGFRLTGGPSVTTTGIDAGNKVITNVASGGTTATNAANIGDITKAISDLTTNLTKNTSISYTANTATPGQTVSLKDGFNFSNGTLTTAEVAANGVVKFNVTQGSLSTDGNGNITNTAGVATTDDVKNAVNTAINKAVTNSSAAVNTLGANTFTLKADSTDTTAQALNKSGGLAFKVAGDGDLVSTSATTDTVKVTVKKGTLTTDSNGNITNTTGVATTDDVKNAVTSAINTAVTKATGAQVLNITDGNNNGSINLKNDALKVVGTDGVTTEVSGKTITVGLDTATKNKINNASAATNKNISLAADTGNASSQSLKDGDVSFAVKGATGDYISTNMNGSTVEISTKRATIDSNAATGEASVTGNDGLATAKNVAAAINAATAKAVSQSAWKLSADNGATTETISGGDTVNFKAGSNMEVIRTGKDITYKTKDNVAFTTVTAGTGANEVKLDGNTGTVTAKDITATGDVNAKNVTTSGNVTAAGTVKGDTVQGNTVKAGNVTITGGTTNTITGLSNTTWNGSTTTPDRAATEGQLQQAISSAASSATFKFDGDNSSQQTMNLQNGTFKVTGDTMITTNATSAGIGLSLNTNNVKIAYAANGTNGQTTSLASGFNFSDGDHTKATVDSSGVVKYNAKTSTISVANGHAAASGNDLATADNVADAINQMTQNNAGNTAQLRQEISKVATETQRVGAHAAAMAALKPIQYDPLAPTQIMAGVGNYRGESAAALGIAHYTNDNTMFNVGVSVGGNHNMINAGVTHKFGISAEKKNIPDRYKAGPISSIYVMQDEMTQLRSENEAYKAKLDKQQSEIDALKAAVDQLLASKA